ncbi:MULTISPECIES: hypothetical protein [unclassified Achromobacter]|uniref:hypothetical protein n=1 Tax=unclassified Achromobacter TaxID=2626865 RepID=UPI000B5175AD|nr:MULTISPECIES: hypothetical protein [unclassified Achromobacter]OWT75437.1 hypothetical protein CEY04_17780 [Achromobacter sp. HZ28]OWT76097.1 hypothetical protein CEY05_13230 [Achromobacter sp. HZ34]
MTIPTPATAYEDRFCAFIDFLGFAAAVERGVWAPSEIVSAMRKAAKVSQGNEEIVRVTQFSDSMILSARADDVWGLYTVVNTAFFLAVELAAHGILLRGGVSKGKMYHKDHLAFGPAFIRAYKLEQAASTPRIILDRNIVSEGPWPSVMDHQELGGMQTHNLPEDNDGWRYVDYLSPHHVDEFDDGQTGLVRHYEKLRELVKAQKDSTDPSLRTKYGWLDKKLTAVGR